MVRSFLAVAMSVSLKGFPAARRRRQKGLMTGLQRMELKAAMQRAQRTEATATGDAALAFGRAAVVIEGCQAGERGDGRATEGAQFGQMPEERGGGEC